MLAERRDGGRYGRPAGRRWPLLLADLGVVLAIILVTPWVVGGAALAAGCRC
ncbi:hypothetical protein V2I01_07555 [Micromonospora sp. BRA006-A]|nr:hypothetical protein [Micromonospora sp. BRA006-A]